MLTAAANYDGAHAGLLTPHTQPPELPPARSAVNSLSDDATRSRGCGEHGRRASSVAGAAATAHDNQLVV